MKSFTVVAIGASVGGLEAVSTLFRNLPSDTGMAFIYVQHLSPNHKSLLTTILSKITKMKVQEIENMEQILPNNVYVIPSNKIIKVTDGHIQLSARQEKEAIVSIDILFTSLAQTHQEKVIGVILSGNASDGTQGLKAIKDAGGITFAQDTSAQANSMPDSAIAAGIVDYVLDPVAIARELVYLSSHNFTKREHIANVATNDLNTIFQLLQKVNGIDFSHYKTPTIRRRINHKMQQKGIRKIQDYIQVLQENSQEVTVLSNDLLINVTKFFRDPDAFFYLETHLFPDLFRRKTAEEVLRIWVPACSTGEEAYSIAMLIHAIQEKNKTTIPVQIFATDLSEVAIAKARTGTYLHRDVQDIAAKYKDRYFTKSGDKYHVIKEIREMCIFAPHNILQDPPFSRMDFVSCCNLLIYFDAAAQKKVFSSLHFALRDGGFLMLGKAESVGTASLLFTQIEPKYKIYLRKKNVGVQRIIQLQPHLPRTIMATKKISPVTKSADHNPIGIENAIDAMLLANYMPACAVINKEMEVLQFRGAVSMFLEHPSGKASLNILKLAKTEFAFELRIAIQEALKTKGTIYKSDIEINIESKMKILSIEVSPLKIDWDEPLLLVVFKLTNPTQPPMASSTTASQMKTTLKDQKIKKLTAELNTIRNEIKAITELQETTFEELQSAHEEIVSSNEEYQTLNEELETSREELEVTNEELMSSNQEFQVRNDLLTESEEYSESIFATIQKPILILDKDFIVKSANNSFYQKFFLKKEATEGRSLFDLGEKQWDLPDLRLALQQTISQKVSLEKFQFSHTFPNIGELTLLLYARLVVQKVNKEQLILFAIEDITEQKVLATQLIEAKIFAERATFIAEEQKEAAENATRAKQQFLANMSHEIRTPMNSIIGFTKVVLKTDLTAKQKEYLTAIQMSGDALIVLINDILDLAKVESGKMTFEQIPFNIATSLSNMIHLFDTKAQEKNIKLTLEHDPKIPEVLLGDPIRLHQIVLNLLSNAVKFTMQGSINVSAHLLEENDEVAKIEISVKDTGVGIDAHNINTIFDNFQQASIETSRKYGGTGLGLAIAKQLVEQQNGSIHVKSIIDKGSTFSFILNFKKTNEIAASESVGIELDHDIKHINVLVVEDMPLNQLLIKTLLDDFGFDRDIVDNGKIAIERLKTKSYDIILMDLQMPEMNGFEATEYIRNTLRSRTPIIALTADVTAADIAKSSAVGMDDYIAKPIDEKVLYQKIIALVQKNTPKLSEAKAEVLEIEQIVYTNLNYLRQRTKNDTGTILQIITAYLDQTPPLIHTMKQSFIEKDWNALHNTVHKMLPSFNIVGIHSDFEIMAHKVIEFARSEQQQQDNIEDFVLQLENVCLQACKELETAAQMMKQTK